jgi:subtilase family serine protease
MRRITLFAGMRAPRERARRFRPSLEILEDRLALSGSTLGDLTGYAHPNVELVNSGDVSPHGAPGQPAGFSPSQISQAYGFNRITFNNGTIQGNGAGQTIAIIDAYNQPNIVSDLHVFDTTYGLADPPSFRVVNQNGGSSLPATDQTWGLEISLDVEWAHAMAPGANILLVEADTNSYSDLMTALNYARSQPNVSVISMSWGGNEWTGETSFDSYFTTPAGHTGITYVASSGDSGSAGAPEYPSVSPNVLAVGGTQLSTDSAGNYLGETGWSGSGGGIGTYESQPSYQHGVVTQTSNARTVPDVSYNASPSSGFAVYDTSSYGGWVQVGGTSAGAPQWASLIAIANQGRALAGKGSLDGGTQTLPAIYQMSQSDFHDITTGSNGGYSAGVGYDLVTGRGSPIADRVVADLVSAGGQTATPPWVASAASATPNPVTGTTTSLSVRGGDNGGSSGLVYTWSVLAAPSGAALPSFSVNGNNAAQNATATFYAAGTYTFEATITNGSGLSVTSDVTVTVNQTLSSVAVTPGSSSVTAGGTVQLTATALDQFGHAMSVQPSWTWTLNGTGSLRGSGGSAVYTSPAGHWGQAVVQASANGASNYATVSFTLPASPPSPPTGTSGGNQWAAWLQFLEAFFAQLRLFQNYWHSVMAAQQR